jgi:imidazolonepropionase-like amidohydrolase
MRAACLLAGLALAAPAAADTVLITADRMVDVIAGHTVERPAVLVRDGVIVQVGTQGGAAPAADRTLALPGLTLVPGLIDMHVHLTNVATIGGYNRYGYSDRFWSAVGVANARAMLEAGVTTVRNLGSAGYDDVGIAQAIDGGFVPGPRVVPAAFSVGPTGGHCDETFLPPRFAASSPGVANGPEALRAKVRELRKYGARVIKICATGGVFSRNTGPGQQLMSEAEMRAVAEEAHMVGLRVAAHAHGTEGIKAAIRAGIDTIEHASLIDDEGIALAKARGTVLSMDIFNSEYTQAEGAKNGVLEENLAKDREVTARQREGFRRAHRAGVTMVMGTDAGVMPHALAPRQLAWMVRYGMTPMQALRAATLNGAEALGSVRPWSDCGGAAGGHGGGAGRPARRRDCDGARRGGGEGRCGGAGPARSGPLAASARLTGRGGRSMGGVRSRTGRRCLPKHGAA